MWTRRQNRAARVHVVRGNWRSFAGLLVVAGALVAGVALLIPSDFDRGLFVGVGTSAAVGTVAYMVLALSGTVPLGMGATAEMWSASELRRLRKFGWSVINGVPLEGRDVDHVLVGPSGLIVAESKWSAYGWRIEPPDERVQAAIHQVSRNARSLRLWDEVKATGAPVRCVVLLWGGGARADAPLRPPKPIQIDEVTTVAYGLTAIRSWLDSVGADSGGQMSVGSMQSVWRALDRLVTERENVDGAAAPPPSMDRAIWTAVGAVVMFVAFFLASLELMTMSRSWWVWTIGSLALFSVGLGLRRWRWIRLPATGGLIGLAVAAAIAAIAAGVVLVR